MATAHPLGPEDGPLFELDDVPPVPDDQEAVAAEIRALMGRYRVSQQRLAAACGLSQRGLSERLSGKTNFTIRELGRVARFFGLSLGALVLSTSRNEDSVPPNGFTTHLQHFYFQQDLFTCQGPPETEDIQDVAAPGPGIQEAA